jgi:hypothetical protein
MFSIEGLVYAVVYLLVLGLICWLLIFLVDYVNPPEPFKKVAKAAIVIIAVLIIIFLLLGFVSGRPILVR